MKLLNDQRATSPVLGEILLIAVVIIIAVVVAAFAYGILEHATKVTTAKLQIEGASVGSSSITIVHMGGDTISNAFTVNASAPTHHLDESVFNALEIRLNGALFEGNATLNTEVIAKPEFEAGDELVLQLEDPLKSGDQISILFVPSNQVLHWTVVV
jgi:FlaG/FlaF family flagellin (archaellin)